MPPAEVAARILPVFASASHESEMSLIKGLVAWCQTGKYKKPMGVSSNMKHYFEDADFVAIGEAIQVLEQARLVRRVVSNFAFIGLTRLGRHALETNTVGAHLGLGGTT